MVAWDDSGALFSDLSAQLRAAGFDEQSAAGLLGAANPDRLIRYGALHALGTSGQVPALIGTPHGMLTQLFVRNGDVPLAEYRRVLSPALGELLETLALVSVRDDTVFPAVSITPYSNQHFLADMRFTCPSARGHKPVMHAREDFVPPPHATSCAILQNVKPRSGRLLDIGTGCGIIGVSLAGHYTATAGIDIEPRAYQFATANAHLNGRDMEVHTADFHGDLQSYGTWDHAVFNAPGPFRLHDKSPDVDPMTAEGVLHSAVDSFLGLLAPSGVVDILVAIAVPKAASGPAEVVDGWLRGHKEVGGIQITEVGDPMLAVPASAIQKGKLPPGSLLANNKEDIDYLMGYFTRTGIREVTTVIVSLSSRP